MGAAEAGQASDKGLTRSIFRYSECPTCWTSTSQRMLEGLPEGGYTNALLWAVHFGLPRQLPAPEPMPQRHLPVRDRHSWRSGPRSLGGQHRYRSSGAQLLQARQSSSLPSFLQKFWRYYYRLAHVLLTKESD